MCNSWVLGFFLTFNSIHTFGFLKLFLVSESGLQGFKIIFSICKKSFLGKLVIRRTVKSLVLVDFLLDFLLKEVVGHLLRNIRHPSRLFRLLRNLNIVQFFNLKLLLLVMRVIRAYLNINRVTHILDPGLLLSKSLLPIWVMFDDRNLWVVLDGVDICVVHIILGPLQVHGRCLQGLSHDIHLRTVVDWDFFQVHNAAAQRIIVVYIL